MNRFTRAVFDFACLIGSLVFCMLAVIGAVIVWSIMATVVYG